jgi:hypothetical protein
MIESASPRRNSSVTWRWSGLKLCVTVPARTSTTLVTVAASGVRICTSSPWRARGGASVMVGRRPQKYQGSKISMRSSRLLRPGLALKLELATQTAPLGISSAVLW